MSISIDDIVRLGARAIEAEHYSPDPAKVLRGAPAQQARNDFEGAGGRLNVGEWRCEPGAWRVAYAADEYEFCQFLEGRVRLIDEAGNAAQFGPGDAFVIPSGFRGVWETLEACRKHYVICRLPQVP